LLLFEMSFEAFVIGTIVGLGIVVWTNGIIQVGDTIRSLEITRSSGLKIRIARTFAQELFQNVSVLFGIAAFVGAITYLLTLEKEPLTRLAGNPYNPLILLYFLLLLFDVCYRLGLTGYISIILIRRNFLLSRLMAKKELEGQIQPGDIREYIEIDKHVFTMILGSLFLIPVSIFIHWHFLLAVLVFFFGATFLVALSILHLEILRARAFPNDIVRILTNEQVGYVGTIRPDGIPHITPTAFIFDRRRIYIATSLKSKKIANLMSSPYVSLYIQSSIPKRGGKSTFYGEGIRINGKARILGRNPVHAILILFLQGIRMLLVQRLMKRKYSGYIKSYSRYGTAVPRAWRIIPLLYRVLVEITPEAIFVTRNGKEYHVSV
ncbi:MAG: pyridoxamine 5'-phosphate oxidase family protein, partial [Candidatus Hodarchaeota archaeon]